MKRLSVAEVHAMSVAELGLDSDFVDLTAVESLAAALRRAGSILCPCSPKTLVQSVVEPMRVLVDDLAAVRVLVTETLETMVGHGDFLEYREIDETASRPATLLYAAPVRFVSRESGSAILIGILANESQPMPPELTSRIDHVNHLRRLNANFGEDVGDRLRQLGVMEISYESWLRGPERESPDKHLARLNRLLDSAPPSGKVDGLSILDWERPVRYYRGRWITPRSESGRFVARRSQVYGADLWSYLEMRDGRPEKLVDLPFRESRWRGCDEAWRLQMAIDAKRGDPQRFRLRFGPNDSRVMQFFSPVPMWAQRRLDSIGIPVSSPGCLFAYRFSASEIVEEVRFMQEALWLDELHDTD